jgi:endonuclease/exonuclease/phosphatase family metal-dependent hydrolase
MSRTIDEHLPGQHRRADVIAVIPLGLLGAAGLCAALRPAAGLAGLFMVAEELLFIATLVLLAPIALLARARRLGAALLALAVIGGLLFGSEWISLPGSGAARHDLSVVTWNLQYGMRTPAETVAQLHGVVEDVVALQELEPDPAAAIESDATLVARYPYRAMGAHTGMSGLGLLSRYPIRDVTFPRAPAGLELVVATPRGDVRVIVGHPAHAYIRTVTPLRLPLTYDPTHRDDVIASLRTRIDAALSAGERLLVLGDFNTSPTEPEYAVLAAGLRDTHVEVGEGPGTTWRPSRLTFLPIAFLRIDLHLTAGAIRPASTWIDCSLPGDHCRLSADYQIDG